MLKNFCYVIIAAFKNKRTDLSEKDLLVEVGVCPLFNIAQKKIGGNAMPGKIETRVEELMKKILDDTEFELVDTEFVKEKDWYLRVFVDKKGGIDLDDCQLLSEKLGNLLDEESVIEGPYILEVSPPGLDRVLKKDKDFLREAGKAVDVTLYAPIDDTKNFTGTLERRDKDFLYLKEFEPIPREKISQVRLHIEF